MAKSKPHQPKSSSEEKSRKDSKPPVPKIGPKPIITDYASL